jgi:HNH endonuclease
VTHPRSAVPRDVKRQLRQEAGFGCCVCGHPFIQYHHIIPWAEDNHSRPEDMMVLCGQCHYLCTVGAINEADQRAHKSRPKNIVDNLVRGQLFINTTELVVNLAGGRAVETPNLLVLSGEVALSARRDPERGRVLLSARIHGQDGQAIGKLIDNEWSMAPNSVWDFESYPLHARVRIAARQIALAIDVRNEEINLDGKWFHQGKTIEFSSAGARIGTNVIKSMNASYCGILIAVG